jgi:hypothetical protein
VTVVVVNEEEEEVEEVVEVVEVVVGSLLLRSPIIRFTLAAAIIAATEAAVTDAGIVLLRWTLPTCRRHGPGLARGELEGEPWMERGRGLNNPPHHDGGGCRVDGFGAQAWMCGGGAIRCEEEGGCFHTSCMGVLLRRAEPVLLRRVVGEEGVVLLPVSAACVSATASSSSISLE